jgi:hypothetical protein
LIYILYKAKDADIVHIYEMTDMLDEERIIYTTDKMGKISKETEWQDFKYSGDSECWNEDYHIDVLTPAEAFLEMI